MDERSERWQRVAEAVKARMRQLGFRKQIEVVRASGLSDATVRVFMTGRLREAEPNAASREQLAETLRWTADSIDRLLDGEEPIELVPTSIDLLAESAGRHQMSIGSEALTRAKVDNDALAAVAAAVEHLTPVIDEEVSRIDSSVSSLRAELAAERAERRSEVQELRDQAEELIDQLAALSAAVDDLRRDAGAASPRAATE